MKTSTVCRIVAAVACALGVPAFAGAKGNPPSPTALNTGAPAAGAPAAAAQGALRISLKDAAYLDVASTLPESMLCSFDAGVTCDPSSPSRDCWRPHGMDLSSREAKDSRAAALLADRPLYCGSTTAVTVTIDKPAASPPLELAGGLAPNPSTPGTFVWYGWTDPALSPVADFVMKGSAAGKCTPTLKTGKPPAACTFLYSTAARTLTFSYAGAADDVASFQVALDNKVNLHAEVDPCPFEVSTEAGRLSKLYVGAQEIIEISAASPLCRERIAHEKTIRLESNGVTLDGAADVRSDRAEDPLRRAFRFHVPESLTAGAHSWNVSSATGPLGTLQLPAAAAAVSAGSQLQVWYGVDKTGGEELNDWHSQQSVDDAAVVTLARGDYFQYVQNTVHFAVTDPELSDVAAELFRRSNKYDPYEACGRTPRPSYCSLSDPEKLACDDLQQKAENDGPDSITDGKNDVVDACRLHTLPWTVHPNSWVNDAWFEEDPWWYQGDKDLARFQTLKDLTFAVFGAHADPLNVQVELADPKNPDRVLLSQEVKIAASARGESLPLPLADALYVTCGDNPPPLSSDENREVDSRSTLPTSGNNGAADVVWNGQTRAADDQDIGGGNCRVRYEPRVILKKLGIDLTAVNRDLAATDQNIAKWSSDFATFEQKWAPQIDKVNEEIEAALAEKDEKKRQLEIATVKGKLPPELTRLMDLAEAERKKAKKLRDRVAQANDLLKYYGNQGIRITTSRDGATSKFDDLTLNPSIAASFKVPVLTDVKNATGVYTVTVALRGPMPPAVVYRPQSETSPKGTTDVPTALGDLEFTAHLRPRGVFGWHHWPIRAFATLPLNVTGVRFPAKPSELKSSSSLPQAQLTTIQAGVALVVEPWNYDTGHNLLPLPMRFVTGLDFLDVSQGGAVVSWVIGGSIAFPLIDLPKGAAADQLGTDLVVNLLYEADVGRAEWPDKGNYFLINFGVNLLTLFGTR